jgi:hypothetical protein
MSTSSNQFRGRGKSWLHAFDRVDDTRLTVELTAGIIRGSAESKEGDGGGRRKGSADMVTLSELPSLVMSRLLHTGYTWPSVRTAKFQATRGRLP